MTTITSTTELSNANPSQDAILLLTRDHKKAQALFKKIEDLKESASSAEKFELAKQVCGDLLIHMMIEESVFYPALREAIDEEDLLNEAQVEHDGAKDLIEQIGRLEPSDPMFDAKLKVLGEQIEHHVKEEEEEMFKEARKANLDLNALGQRLLAAKKDLRRELGLPPEEMS
jgi:hemerythrin superfamily protein